VVPFDLPVNTRHQLLITRGSSLNLPESVIAAEAHPAIFTTDQTGKGQGLVFGVSNSGTQNLADRANPVRAGDTVITYCSGLGRVDPPAPAGSAAPSSPLSRTVHPVGLTIGGVKAAVLFAGLVPGATGLYQINATVPQGVPTGDAVPGEL